MMFLQQFVVAICRRFLKHPKVFWLLQDDFFVQYKLLQKLSKFVVVVVNVFWFSIRETLTA